MKKVLISFLVITSLFLIGCEKKEETKKGKEEKIETVSNIILGEKQYIEEMVPIKINNSEDTITITGKVKFEVPEHAKDGNVDFAIVVPYAVVVDGVEYTGIYYLSTLNLTNKVDENPRYNVQITDLTENYEAQVLIEKKD